MKTEFEEKDIEAIAQRVSELLKPIVSRIDKADEKDAIFDVKGLAEYLHVNASWVYQQVHTHSIPFLKIGKYPRFKRKEIDRWMESKAVRPIPVLKAVKTRG